MTSLFLTPEVAPGPSGFEAVSENVERGYFRCRPFAFGRLAEVRFTLMNVRFGGKADMTRT
jgi:hypothetical protein